jgi:hypothetical protein
VKSYTTEELEKRKTSSKFVLFHSDL